MSGFLDTLPIIEALRQHGVSARDRFSAAMWWTASRPGQTLMLVRYGAPHLLITHEGEVTEVAPPTPTRTDYAAAWYEEHET